MYEIFELPVTYKNQSLLLPARLVPAGYTHVFKVEVEGQELTFEPDEEGAYRAVVNLEEMDKQPNVDLLEAVARGIEAVVR